MQKALTDMGYEDAICNYECKGGDQVAVFVESENIAILGV